MPRHVGQALGGRAARGRGSRGARRSSTGPVVRTVGRTRAASVPRTSCRRSARRGTARRRLAGARDRAADVGDRAVERVDRRRRCGPRDSGNVAARAGALELQAGGEQPLDDQVVQVAGDRLAGLATYGAARLAVLDGPGAVEREGGLVGERAEASPLLVGQRLAPGRTAATRPPAKAARAAPARSRRPQDAVTGMRPPPGQRLVVDQAVSGRRPRVTAGRGDGAYRDAVVRRTTAARAPGHPARGARANFSGRGAIGGWSASASSADASSHWCRRSLSP